jgi:hypothetical protein
MNGKGCGKNWFRPHLRFLSWHLPRGTKENHNLNWGSQLLGWNVNLRHSEYKCYCFYGAQRFSKMLTEAYYWDISWARRIHPLHSYLCLVSKVVFSFWFSNYNFVCNISLVYCGGWGLCSLPSAVKWPGHEADPTHLHLVSKLSMHAAIPTLCYMPSWCVAQFYILGLS